MTLSSILNQVRPTNSVLARMQAQIVAWNACADRRSVFLSCYCLMTANMDEALRAGRFVDSVWVSRLLERFAEYYFEALAAWESDPSSAPAVWQLAHQACCKDGVPAVQTLLLGINAHINYDLVLVLVELLQGEWAALEAGARAARYDDYCAVNEVIAETIDAVQDTILAPVEPFLGVVDKALGTLDELLISRLITHWRGEVWQHSVRLLEAPSAAERMGVRQAMEAEALGRAAALLGQRGLVGLPALL